MNLKTIYSNKFLWFFVGLVVLSTILFRALEATGDFVSSVHWRASLGTYEYPSIHILTATSTLTITAS